MTSAVRPGLFLVLEGGEGVGKTTQWSRLAELLSHRGHRVLALREPGGTVAGDALRRILLDPDSHLSAEAEALLFSASRAQLVSEVLSPALSGGEIVLLDRFILSTYAYQGAGRGLSMDQLREVTRFATGGLVPDLTLLLSLPVDKALPRALARGAADRMEQESAAFHARVARAFEDAAADRALKEYPDVGPVAYVDASGSIEEVTQRCVNVLAERWPDRFSKLVTELVSHD